MTHFSSRLLLLFFLSISTVVFAHGFCPSYSELKYDTAGNMVADTHNDHIGLHWQSPHHALTTTPLLSVAFEGAAVSALQPSLGYRAVACDYHVVYSAVGHPEQDIVLMPIDYHAFAIDPQDQGAWSGVGDPATCKSKTALKACPFTTVV